MFPLRSEAVEGNIRAWMVHGIADTDTDSNLNLNEYSA